MKVPILRIYDQEKQKYVGIPAIRGEPGKDGAPDAVRFTEQALTDAEKAQARGNIDAPKTVHSHTKSQITDFPTSFVNPADPATEGYVKLGVLTGSNQSFTVPVIPSEIMIAANNISGGSAAPSVVFDDSDDGVSLGSARKPQYSGSASYSSLSFRKILHLAGFDTYYGASDGGVYAHTEVSSSTNSWLASQKTLKLETTFKAKLSSEPRSGTVELWYHR